MTSHPRTIALISAALVALGFSARAADPTDRLEALSLEFRFAVEKVEKELVASVEKLNGGYKKALTALQLRMSSGGDLDGAVAVSAEIKRLDSDQEPSSAAPSKIAALADLQGKYLGAWEKYHGKRNLGLRDATSKHLAKLEKLKRDLTVSNELQSAVVVRDEIERVKKNAPPPPKPTPKSTGGTGIGGLPAKPLLCFSFDKAEADGRVLDKSGNDHHGESAENSWEKQGKRGGGFNFTGRDRIKVPHDDSLNPESLTVAAWVNLEKPSAHGRIIDKYEYFAKSGYAFTVADYRPCFEACDTERSRYAVKTDAALSVGEWNHVAVTYDAGEVIIYINGRIAKKETIGKALRPNDSPLRVGLDEGRSLNGLMDELVIYPRALSELELGKLISASGR